MSIVIARPELGDTEEIRALFRLTVEHTFKTLAVTKQYTNESNALIKDLSDALDRDLSSGGAETYFLIATDNSRIVGTIAFGPANHIIREHIKIDTEKTPEIKSAYILPEYQGKGIGSLLFDAILSHLRKKGYTQYCLDCGFHKAQQFWRKKLGEPEVLIRDYFEKHAHYMIWKRKIPD